MQFLKEKETNNEVINNIEGLQNKNCDYENLIISIETLKVIKDFLDDIRSNCYLDSFSRKGLDSAYVKRSNFYQENYESYLMRVPNEDRCIFKKLINYLTAQSSYILYEEEFNNYVWHDEEEFNNYVWEMYKLYKGSSNLPLSIKYVIDYKGTIKQGIYKSDTQINESRLGFNLLSKMRKEFFIKDDPITYITPEGMNVELYIGYDFELDLSNLDDCMKKISDIVNSEHYKNWRFEGVMTKEERKLLNYIYEAKYEVLSHPTKSEPIIGNITTETCRYLGSLISQTKIGSLTECKTVEEKNKLYNSLLPLYLEEICPENRDIFCKLANYLTFENEDFSITGYNHYYNRCKKSIISRIDMFNKVKSICDVYRENKTSIMRETALSNEIESNYHVFKYHFVGGAGISETSAYKSSSVSNLLNVLSNEEFIHWPFEGLKTEMEKVHELEYEDLFNNINFSEESYFVLSYYVNTIYEKECYEERLSVKNKLYNKMLQFIPYNERETFNRLLEYFTNENEIGFAIDPDYISLKVKFYERNTNMYKGSITLDNCNCYGALSDEDMVKNLKELTTPLYKSKRYVPEDIRVDNYMDKYYWTYTPISKVLYDHARCVNSNHYTIAKLKCILNEIN